MVVTLGQQYNVGEKPIVMLYTCINHHAGTRNKTKTKNVVCVCVCVFFPFILDIKFVGRTSRGHTRGRSHRISHPPSFYGACLYFSRDKRFSHFFPSSTVKSNFVYQRFNRSPLVGHFFVFCFLFFSEKNPVCRDRTHVPTCQEGYEVYL